MGLLVLNVAVIAGITSLVYARASRIAHTALRENLKRRKSQSRVRKAAPTDAPPEIDTADAESPGKK